MKKKFYEQPEMKVVKLYRADIICTSGNTEDYENGNTTGWY